MQTARISVRSPDQSRSRSRSRFRVVKNHHRTAVRLGRWRSRQHTDAARLPKACRPVGRRQRPGRLKSDNVKKPAVPARDCLAGAAGFHQLNRFSIPYPDFRPIPLISKVTVGDGDGGADAEVKVVADHYSQTGTSVVVGFAAGPLRARSGLARRGWSRE